MLNISWGLILDNTFMFHYMLKCIYKVIINLNLQPTLIGKSVTSTAPSATILHDLTVLRQFNSICTVLIEQIMIEKVQLNKSLLFLLKEKKRLK